MSFKISEPVASSPLAPILVIDSGLGGLTVAAALRRRLPHEKLIYFGDTARVPYGTKSAVTVTSYVAQIVRYLKRYEPKFVLLACNSASAVALDALREQFPGLFISGVIEPGARAAAAAAGDVREPFIAVIATPTTVRSRAYERAIVRRRSRCRILQRATPLLVPIIEEGRAADDPLVTLCLEQYLLPIRAQRPDVLVLGCTHYPMLRTRIEQIMGPECRIVDSAEACAEDVAARLTAASLLRPAMADALDPQPPLRLFASDESPRLLETARWYLGERLAQAKVISPDRLHEYDRPAPARRPIFCGQAVAEESDVARVSA